MAINEFEEIASGILTPGQPAPVAPAVVSREDARQQRMEELKTERERKAAAAAAQRAASNPLLDPTTRPAAPPADDQNVYYYGWIGGAGSGQWKLYKTGVDSPQAASAEARAEGGKTQATFTSAVGANTIASAAATTPSTTAPSTATPSTATPSTTAVTPTPTVTTTTTTTTTPTITPTTTATPTLARETFKNTLAQFFGQTEAAKAWTDALYNVVSKYFRTGSDAVTSFNLALQDARTNPELKPFADRFKGIYALQDMRNAGRPVKVPTIGEYVAAQTGMADVLTEAGLGSLATEEFTGDLISKGNSVSGIADKISRAFARIDLAPKAIKDTLSRYFPTVDRPTLARTILLGEKGTEQLVDELAKYEVLAAAEQQGVAATPERPGGVTMERAGEYAKAGQTFQSLLPKFGQIAQAMPDVTKLAGISRRPDLGQVGVERAVIEQSAKDIAELQRLSEEEEARFAGRTGIAQTGLASQRRANRAF